MADDRRISELNLTQLVDPNDLFVIARGVQNFSLKLSDLTAFSSLTVQQVGIDIDTAVNTINFAGGGSVVQTATGVVEVTIANSFLTMPDTPNSYLGLGGQSIRVNVAEDGLEFFNFTDEVRQQISIEAGSTSYLGYDNLTGEISIKNLTITGVTTDAVEPDLATWVTNNYTVGDEFQEGDIIVLTAPSGGTEMYIHNGGVAVTSADFTGIELPTVDSLTGLSDTNGTSVGDGFLRWNAGGTQVDYILGSAINLSTFNDDLTKGIYDGSGTTPSATSVTLTDTLQFTGGEVEIIGGVGDNPLRVDSATATHIINVQSDGNIGIRNSTATELIHIKKGDNTAKAVKFESLTDGTSAVVRYNLTNTGGDVLNINLFEVSHAFQPNTASIFTNSARLILDMGSTNYHYFEQDGKVGINRVTGLPSAQLHITGNSGVNPLRVDTNTINNALLVGSNGKVGIGVASPLYDLHAERNGSVFGHFESTNSGQIALIRVVNDQSARLEIRSEGSARGGGVGGNGRIIAFGTHFYNDVSIAETPVVNPDFVWRKQVVLSYVEMMKLTHAGQLHITPTSGSPFRADITGGFNALLIDPNGLILFGITPNTDVTADPYLLTRNATGEVQRVLASSITSTDNIYTTNGTLGADRTVTMNSTDLTFASTGDAQTLVIDGGLGHVGIGAPSHPAYKFRVSANQNTIGLFQGENSGTSAQNILELRDVTGANLQMRVFSPTFLDSDVQGHSFIGGGVNDTFFGTISIANPSEEIIFAHLGGGGTSFNVFEYGRFAVSGTEAFLQLETQTDNVRFVETTDVGGTIGDGYMRVVVDTGGANVSRYIQFTDSPTESFGGGGGGDGNGIYTGSGSLSATTTVTMGGNNLTFTATSGDIIYNSGARTNQLVLDGGNGNVGIGKTAPSNILDIEQSLDANARINIKGTSATKIHGLLSFNDLDDFASFQSVGSTWVGNNQTQLRRNTGVISKREMVFITDSVNLSLPDTFTWIQGLTEVAKINTSGRLQLITNPISAPSNTNVIVRNAITGELEVNTTIGGGSSLFTDGGATTYLTSTTDNLAIGLTSASAKLHVEGDSGAIAFRVDTDLVANAISVTDEGVTDFGGTKAIKLPSGNQLQYPTVALNGMMRYSNFLSKFEAYENGAWVEMISGNGIFDSANNFAAIGGNDFHAVMGAQFTFFKQSIGSTANLRVKSQPNDAVKFLLNSGGNNATFELEANGVPGATNHLLIGNVAGGMFFSTPKDFAVNTLRLIVKETTGRVGISVVNPSSRLHVVGGATEGAFRVDAGTNLNAVTVQSDGSVLMRHLPTSAPVTPGALWNNGGVINIV